MSPRFQSIALQKEANRKIQVKIKKQKQIKNTSRKLFKTHCQGMLGYVKFTINSQTAPMAFILFENQEWICPCQSSRVLAFPKLSNIDAPIT